MNGGESILGKHLIPVTAFLFLVGMTLFLSSLSLHQEFDHDEHQFVASAVLIANHHLVPYRDFPFFHTPNLLFAYAVLFRFTSRLLLGARLFSAACAELTMFVIFMTTLRLWKRPWNLMSLLVAAAAVLLLVSQPLFLYTSGRAWNHDLPLLLLLVAVLAHCKWMRTGKVLMLFLSAALVGFAAGTRLSYVPPVMAFVGGIVFVTRTTTRWRSLAVFASGLAMSLIPTAVTFVLAPARFLFGTLGFARLSNMYRREIGYQRAMTLGGKLAYLGSLLVEHRGALLLLTLLFVAIFLLVVRQETGLRLELTFITAVIFCCLLGALAPSPSQIQYFYQPIPFLVLGIVFGIASLRAQAKTGDHTLVAFLLASAVISSVGLSSYSHPRRLAHRSGSVDEGLDLVALQTRARVGSGKVLTLAPMIPLEGGLDIYPEFSTGPFAWRTAHLLDPTDRVRFRMVSAMDLELLLRPDPPSGILVGAEVLPLEDPLIQYAKRHDYVPLPMSNGLTVWVPRVQLP